MNLIACILLVVLNFQLTTGAYKKRRNEQCSLLVNGMCYDDELNDRPLKIVHDEHGMKSVAGSKSGKVAKKNKKKISTDVLQSKSWEQKFPKFKELFGNAKLKYGQPAKLNASRPPDQQPPKLIFKYHKLEDPVNRRPTFTGLPRPILDTSTIMPANSYGQLPTLVQPTIVPTTAYPHLSAFKTINRPLLGSGSFQRYSYPLVSPFLNSLSLRLPEHYREASLLLTDESPSVHRKTAARLVANHQLKSLPSSQGSSNGMSGQSNGIFGHKSTTSTTSSWLPDFFSTVSNIVPPLPTNLTNYINMRESGRLFASSSDENNYNTTQDRAWTDDDSNELLPTRSSSFDQFREKEGRKNKTKSDPFQFDSSIESDDARNKDLLTTDLSSHSHDSPFSTEESSKESLGTAFKLSNQLGNQLDSNGFRGLESSNEFETTKARNRPSKYLEKDAVDKFGSLDSKEFANEKFESSPSLSNPPHDWSASIDSHQLDELLSNGKSKQNDLKSTINYLADDEQKANLLSNNHQEPMLHENFPVFYPLKHHPNNKPTYTIIQMKDKNFQNLDKWKQTMKSASKLIKKVAIEEAKKFKKNELDTFLKRKKLIIDRYKPNDYYQKALAAKYVWKKVSLDFLSLLGYQIANYLGPLNAKHWIKHSDLVERNPDQLKALEHLLKSQHFYYPATNDPYLSKYLLSGGQLPSEHNGLAGDEFSSVHGTGLSTGLGGTGLGATGLGGTGLEHFGSSAADQFLNDDTFFKQNYFKLKENDAETAFLGGPHANKLTVTSEEPLMASSLTNEVDQSKSPFDQASLKTEFDETSIKGPFDQAKNPFDQAKNPFELKSNPFQPPPALTEKEKELDKHFFTNQLLNQKLLSQHLVTDPIIDFRTKEELLNKVIKPIKITQQTD